MFRQMRRSKQELSRDECERVLKSGSYGVLACSGDDGYPYAVPVNYIWHNGTLYFHCAKVGHKMDAIAREPKASFCVVDKSDLAPERFTTYFRSVIAFGHARVVTDADEAFDALDALTVGLAHEVDQDETRKELEACRRRPSLAMVAIDIDHLSGKEAVELVKAREKGDEAGLSNEAHQADLRPAPVPGASTKQPPELTDRQLYETRIGPVCMSKVEHEAYLEELERRGESGQSFAE
jgi:nitroimidazol reductase NimA-like FMN-containing flavoprotein (pyridoxamine 5'-phosphate oxidase superfamily)